MTRKLGGSVSWATSQALSMPHHPMSLQKADEVDLSSSLQVPELSLGETKMWKSVKYADKRSSVDKKLDTSSGRKVTLRLTFLRRGFMKGIDPQPFTYDIDISGKQFKELMDTPTMGAMAFYVTRFRPTPTIESTVHGRARSLVAGSRSATTEGHRLRKEFAHIEQKMKTNTRMDTSKLYHVSTCLGSSLSMSTSEPNRSTHGNKAFGVGKQVEVPPYTHTRTATITGATTGSIGLAGVRNDSKLRESFRMTQSTCYPGLPKLQYGTKSKLEKQRHGVLDRRMIEVQPRQKCGHRLRGRSGLEFAVKSEYQINESHQCVFHVCEAPDPTSEYDDAEWGE